MGSSILSSSPTQLVFFLDTAIPAAQVLSITSLTGAAQANAVLLPSPLVPALAVNAGGNTPTANPSPLTGAAGAMVTSVVVRNVTALTGALSATISSTAVDSATAAVVLAGPTAVGSVTAGGVSVLAMAATNLVVQSRQAVVVTETVVTAGTRQYVLVALPVQL